uniref:Testis expressed gene 16 n=1 Tax=Nannospalax galili TaxID=1026970 RepID=A0A8C6QJR0_NANGA
MASDSIKCLMESEEKVMENENFWIIPDAESSIMESDKERGRVVAASTSKVHLLLDEKAEKPRSKRYMLDSDSDLYLDSGSEKHELASVAVKCLEDVKTFQLRTSPDKLPENSQSEKKTVNSDSESPGIASDSVTHLKKAGMSQNTCNLERLQEGRILWLGSKRKLLEFDHGRQQASSEKYQLNSLKPQDSSGIYQNDHLTFQSSFERDESQADSSSETHQTHSGSERDQNEPESTGDLIKIESRLENEDFQMDEESKGSLMESDKEKGHERYRHDSENEAQRLGARRKDNRPPGFWRPVSLSPQLGLGKKTEEQSVQHSDDRVSSIPLMKSKSENKDVKCKALCPCLSDKQLSQENYSSSPDSNTFTDEMNRRKASHKISIHKCHCKEFTYSHSCQSFRSQISHPRPLSSENYSLNVPSSSQTPTSTSPKCVIQQKTQKNITCSLNMKTQRCARYFMETSKSFFHKFPMNSDDSASDSPLPTQISLDSKHSLSSKTYRHCKISRNRLLSQSADRKHHVGSHCPLHKEESKHSSDSASYLNCESCSALQNLKGSTVTSTFPMHSENVMGQHSIHGQVVATPITPSESESKFNLTASLQSEDKPDNETKLRNPKNETDVKYKLLPTNETNDEDETNTEDETDDDETDSEDEDNAKDKKDPKDKSDPDDSDPKDGNSENNTESGNGSDPSGAAEPTSGPDSSNDVDSGNAIDRSNESDPADNATNNDVNLKYSTDEVICADNSDNASALIDDATQQNTVDSKNSIHPNCTSGNQNRTVLDFISSSNNDIDPRNTIGSGNDTDPNNFNSQNNTHAFQKLLDFNYNTNPSNNNNSHNAIIPYNIADPKYGIKPTSITSHKHIVALNYYLDQNCVTGLTYEIKSVFAVNPNCSDRNHYLARPRFAASAISPTDTRNTTDYSGAVSSHFTTGKSYASNNKHFHRFTYCSDLNVTNNPNYNALNIQNIHYFVSSRIINNLPDPELQISSKFSILKFAYGNISNFVPDTNYSSFPDYLIASKFHDPLELGRAYIIFDDQNIGAQFQESTGGMDSVNYKHATGSVDALDATESGFLKDFSRVQNPVGIKDPATLKILSNPNIPLPNFDVIVEAELPDVVKFVISPGALNHFCKNNFCGFSRDNTSLEIQV